MGAAPVSDERQVSSNELGREIRLGLVLSGGVSLATYINGSAIEVEKAVRGDGAYRWVKALTDADIVVDVISGTSAGGINGVALAYALANGGTMAGLSDLWRRDGDLAGLLRDAGETDRTINSVLDGDRYHALLKSAFASMPIAEERGQRAASRPWYVSDCPHLDLFVTGTRVQPSLELARDSAGNGMVVEDHRALFLVKHRRGRKEHLDPGSYAERPELLHDTLATLSRITSCFPGAFPPVRVEPATALLSATDATTTDELLRHWGRLTGTAAIDLIDGGVLDNKPFTGTLESVFTRPAAARTVDRLLYFIEPHPSAGASVPITSEPDKPPTFLEALVKAKAGIPSSEPFTDDLRRLVAHNEKTARYRRMARNLQQQAWTYLYPSITAAENAAGPAPAAGDPPDADARPAPSDPSGLDAGAGPGDNPGPGAAAAPSAARPPVNASWALHERSRLVQIGDVLADAVLSGVVVDDPDGSGSSQRQLEARTRDMMEAFDPWTAQPQNRELLLTSDILFCRRRLEHIVSLLGLFLDDPGSQAAGSLVPLFLLDWDGTDEELLIANIRTLRGRLIAQLGLYEVVSRAIQRALATMADTWTSRTDESAAQRWDRLGRALRHLMETPTDLQIPHPSDENFGPLLEEFRTVYRLSPPKPSAADAVVPLTAPDGDVRVDAPATWHERFVSTERDLISEELGSDAFLLFRVYDNFARLDAILHPLDTVAGLGEKVSVDLVRISPSTSRLGFSDPAAHLKIAGDLLNRFGGFLKRSWRSNDILWGHLDGAGQLLDSLFSPSTAARSLDTDQTRARAHGRFFDGSGAFHEAMSPTTLFPNAGAGPCTDLRGRLTAFLEAETPEERRTVRGPLIELLIQMHQLEILHDLLPRILQDALHQQTEWNRVSSTPLLPIPTNEQSIGWATLAGSDVRVDPLVAITAAAQRAKEVGTGLFGRTTPPTPPNDKPPRLTPIGAFFTDGRYRVGSETITRDIPAVVLLEQFVHALLLVRTCLLNSLESGGAVIRGSLVYRVAFDFPMRFLYRYAFAARFYPGGMVAFVTALCACAVLALVLGFVFWDELLRVSSDATRLDRFGNEIVIRERVVSPNRLLLFIGLPLLVLYVGKRLLSVTHARRLTPYIWGARVLRIAAVVAPIVGLIWLLTTADFPIQLDDREWDLLWPFEVDWRRLLAIIFLVAALIVVSARRIWSLRWGRSPSSEAEEATAGSR